MTPRRRVARLTPARVNRKARELLGRWPGREGDAAEPKLLRWPLDHYYSPIPDSRVLAREPARSRVWPPTPRGTPGIDWREEEQIALLHQLGNLSEMKLAETATGDPREYYSSNEMFASLDGWVLQGMLRHFRPRRMIEVGSGFSSLLTARVNREYLDGLLDFTCIEPEPADFLKAGIDGISRLIISRVEELSVDPFLELGDGDILFIDTSHVAKTGGDVVFLYQEVLPRLAPGVIVQIHDIFLPADYPPAWVLSGRAWNEQYLVHAFLTFNSAFHVLLGVAWLSINHGDLFASVFPGAAEDYHSGGGSLWIQRV
jgi:predicted O-methyltransferase YrrM